MPLWTRGRTLTATRCCTTRRVLVARAVLGARWGERTARAGTCVHLAPRWRVPTARAGRAVRTAGVALLGRAAGCLGPATGDGARPVGGRGWPAPISRARSVGRSA